MPPYDDARRNLGSPAGVGASLGPRGHEGAPPAALGMLRCPLWEPLNRAAELGSRSPMKVLAGITKALTNREIADVLGVSIKSIQWHAKHAYRKIGVGIRQEAVTWCLLHGFEAPGESGPG